MSLQISVPYRCFAILIRHVNQKWVCKKWPRQGIQVWPDTKSGVGAVAVRFGSDAKSGGLGSASVTYTLVGARPLFRKNRAGSILPVHILDNSHPVAKKKKKTHMVSRDGTPTLTPTCRRG